MLAVSPRPALTASPAALPADVIKQRAAALMAIGKSFAALPVLDNRSDDEILGYDDYGLPT